MTRSFTPAAPPALPAPAPRAALALYAVTAATFFGASSAPTPLYRMYQQLWGFSSGTLTLVFGVYALSLLVALLTTGALSDHLGRRKVILGALVLEALSMPLFAHADGVPMLIAARVLQGFATGIASSALAAAIMDCDRARGTLVNSAAPILGMAVGALGTSMLVQYAPAPLHLAYYVFFGLFVLEALGVFALPDTIAPRPGALASLRPTVRVPAVARSALLRVAPVTIAVWALGGFYLSLGPTLARAVTGSDAITTGGWVVFTLTTSAAVTVLLLRAWTGPRLLRLGAAGLVTGLLTTLAGVHTGHPTLFFLGTLLAGVGFGSAFQGALRTLLPLAAAHERAGLVAAFYVLSYLAFCLPALVAGLLVHAVGLRPTVDAYALALVLLAATALAGGARTRKTAAAA
ncbi:MAG: MFS transporter [Pseudomonadota bacterium]